jgi:condensin complex subunit 3
MIPLIVSGLEVLDDELSRRIIANLSKRLRDKETAVRAQSVHGLHIFVRNGAEEEEDDDDSDDETHGTILHKLLDVMQNDPSAEVRRAVLRNIDYSPTTIRYMLERARDEDAITRRILYRVVLPTLADFRALSLVEREKLIRWGLRDRDEQVRKAAARLFRETWIDTCASSNRAPPDAEDKPAEAAPVSMDALLELLERIQVVRSGVEGGIAHEAMREFWDGRPDYIEILTFDDSFLKDLSPESAFVMRSFNDYCLAVDDVRVQTLLDEKMPEVRKLAEIITDRLNDLIEKNSKIAELDTVTQEEEDEFRSLEFVAEQLLHIALTLDYSDEVGRRKIFNVMRGALSLPQLPEGCTSLAVETLRTVCGKRESGEKEFISVVREVIQDVRDTLHDNDNGNETPRSSQAEEDEESFHSAQSDISEDDAIAAKPRKKQAEMTEEDIEKEEDRQAYVFAKCLHIAECMVQNIDCEIEKNDDLIWLLNNLISPACKNHQIVIREAGIKCLGLYSIHSKVSTLRVCT